MSLHFYYIDGISRYFIITSNANISQRFFDREEINQTKFTEIINKNPAIVWFDDMNRIYQRNELSDLQKDLLIFQLSAL